MNSKTKYEKIISILKCINCNSSNLDISNSEAFVCPKCNEKYPIVNGILRFVPESYMNYNENKNTIEEKTKNYFGFEWQEFDNWGFIDDNCIDEKNNEFFGGTISARKLTFDSKCRLSLNDLKKSHMILDAGCGNGRYTYEAAERGDAIVIGVDIGYGSVESAFKNNAKHENVYIIQASLFQLPFIDEVFDASFANGVLMHTGNAEKAFFEIARTIKKNGKFVVNIYHKLNPLWELNDFLLRLITVRMSVKQNMLLAGFLARIGRVISKSQMLFIIVNLFFRIQPTIHHMFDWYSAPIATHHTYKEVAGWFTRCHFHVLDSLPKHNIFRRPWALNLKGQKK